MPPSPENIIDVNNILNDSNEISLKKSRFTPHQWKLFIILIFVNLCSAMCYSIQAPFYPKEAEKKGVTSSVYGMVFGVFEFVVFVLCPIYGKYIRQIGLKFMLNAGNFVMATCCILFGFLDNASKTSFIVLSFIVRIVEAMGQAGSMTASYAIVSSEFSDNLAFALTAIETAFGVGVFLGPSVGGLLFEFGGFLLPFAVNGGALMITAIVTVFLLPENENANPKSLSLLKLLRIPSIVVCYYTVFALTFSIGYTTVLLERFLKSKFDISTAIVGLVFIVPGVIYVPSTFVSGILADKYVHPMIICAAGGALISIAFLFLGPASFFHIKPTLWLVIVCLVLHGFGLGAEYIAAFINCNKEAIRHGFPENIETYGLISGLWASGWALGSFIGPIAAGFIGEADGFQNGTLVICGQHILVVIFSLICFWYQKKNLTEKEELIELLEELPN
uniref:Major facilitator superfamily (MFS) profile domain-containing protein n=1 Tax=Strigamia maritima TaxID=126957 RepID=T1J6T4_STRMM